MKLFEPGRIGKLKIKNRIVMLPMGTRYADEQGFVTDRIINYYQERAKGGAGLIIVEITCVDSPAGKAIRNSLVIDDDKFIPGLGELATAIKKHGARAAIQLGHAGNAGRFEVTGVEAVAPSAIKRPGLYEVPRELTIEEIKRLVTCFAKAAERAKRAGFDGVEIHGAHLYLISQFLSSAWNKRDDVYGGPLKNRARLLLEIIGAVRMAVGEDYPLWCRLNGEEEGIEGGTDLAEAQQVAQLIQARLDALSISAAGTGALAYLKTSPDLPGALLPLAKAIKEVVEIPVIAAGRMTPDIGNDALEKGMADFIGFGRSMISDPQLPRKIAEGRTEEIRPCIVCLKCYLDEQLACSVNACAGKENELSIRPAKKPRKVFIAGGGPAGMEAARVAALMGHRVTLFEKGPRLGGQLLLAHLPPEKKKMIEPLTSYLTNQLIRLGIEIKLGEELTGQLIDQEKPDAVIIATGINAFVPDIPGVGRPNVIKALDVLVGTKKVGESAVIIGGELVGCETADFLASEGKKVVIVRRGPRMAAKMVSGRRQSLLERLSTQGVAMLTNVNYEEITDKGLVITNREGKRQLIEADSVILAAGSRPNRKLLDDLKELYGDVKVFQAGDCIDPRGIREAIEEGHRIALFLEQSDSN